MSVMPTVNARLAVAGSNDDSLIDGAVDHAKRACDGLGELLGVWGWLHARRRPHEQSVVRQLAQASEGVAYRRLRQAKRNSNFRDAALKQELVEDHQQIQVDVL